MNFHLLRAFIRYFIQCDLCRRDINIPSDDWRDFDIGFNLHFFNLHFF